MIPKDTLKDIFPTLNLPPVSYAKLIKSHRTYSKKTETFKIKILSNIIINPIKEILELTLWNNNIMAQVSIGEYDNIIQDSLLNDRSDCVVVFWELWNLFPNAASKLEILSEKEFLELQNKFKEDLLFTIKNLTKNKLTLFNLFSTIPYNRSDGSKNKLNILADFCNNILKNIDNSNFILIDIDQIHTLNSSLLTTDLRYTHKNKSLYTPLFFRHYSSIVCINIMNIQGMIKKVLILDCDNTLWRGVLGEEGINGIDMASTSSIGSIFNDVQLIFKSFKKKGVLICLCTKNNEEDINELMNTHPDLLIKKEDLVYIAANWDSKPNNIIKISKSLNLGLDSFVFIDDSDFEIGLMKEKLPEVTSLKVPEELANYPLFAINLSNIFNNKNLTQEDLKRTDMYKAQVLREQKLKESDSVETYLQSLEMKLLIFYDSKRYLNRIAQMTQKTNQFNLTTIRMSETEVLEYINSDNNFVVCSSLLDRYGDNGVTAACFISYDGPKVARIDNLLVSCRVLGRNVEDAFFNEIINEIFKRGAEKILAKFVPSTKNMQVDGFYEKFGFEKIKDENNVSLYSLEISKFIKKIIKHIKYDIKNES
jgi:FkbH-like protein